MRNAPTIAAPISSPIVASLAGPQRARYRRAQAIADGVLVDVSRLALGLGYRRPVAISAAALGAAEEHIDDAGAERQDLAALSILLRVAGALINRPAADAGRPLKCVAASVPIVVDDEHDDAGRAVYTIMLPCEF